ncbi:CRTAC1 family protein [Maritalea mobilis]|uniref:CRTAC1 family protein n=1 Tax=Maritalea mobilis TaxID=483324 RepID=UPI001C95E86B|nr:CRTAC1 family protein [Maritalea mobilis]MBY6200995.1 CRTAC1 family protein [Maritalea mobilis]
MRDVMRGRAWPIAGRGARPQGPCPSRAWGVLAKGLALHLALAAPGLAEVGAALVVFLDQSERLHLPDREGVRRPFTAEAFGIVIGDMGGGPEPDVYLNHHHRWVSGAAAFPDAQVVYDPGAPDGPTDWQVLNAWDQHGAVLVDLDGDGDRDLVEAQGGEFGRATWDQRAQSANRVFLNAPEGFVDENAVDRFGLAHDLGSAYVVTPVNLGGRLGLIFGARPRSDWLFSTTLYVAQEDGTWAPEPGRFRVGSPNGMVANLAQYRQVIPGFFDADDVLDLVFAQSTEPPHTVLFRGTEDGVFVTTGEDLLNGWSTDGVALRSASGAPDSIWLTNRNRRFAPWFDTVLRCCGMEEGDWHPFHGVPPEAASHAVTQGDFDNDMDADAMTLVSDGEGGWRLIFWENDGTDRFEAHSLPHGGMGEPIAIAVGDLNLDGALDLVIGDGGRTTDTSYTLLMGAAPRGNWVQIDLRDPWSLDGLGARVWVSAGGRVQALGQTGGSHWAAQDHVRLHVGLGAHDTAVVEVSWPDGALTRDTVEAGRIVTLRHPDMAPD